MSKPFEGLGKNPIARALAWAYGLGQRTHAASRLLNVQQVTVPVISVGNLLVGGTGKTPLAATIASKLAEKRQVAIVSRGYGGTEKGPVRLGSNAEPQRFGDEPVELASLVPNAAVWVARDRAAGAAAAIQAGAQVIVLDDGFGFRGLHRDIDLLLFDERGLGNGQLLPAGPLREPPSAIARADAVIVRNDAAAPPGWTGPLFRFTVAPGGLVDWSGKPHPYPAEAVAAAGVAWPGRFFDALEKQGVRLTRTFPLTDHAPWPPSLARKIEKAAGGRPVIITGKDAVKLQGHPPPGDWLIARQQYELEPAFWPWIAERATLL